MSATKTRRQPDEESVAQIPQTLPIGIGAGLPGHDFTLQAVMELQKSVGEINANLQAMKSSLDSVKSKVDDLVGWKNKILGGFAVLAVVITFLWYVGSKASEYVILKPSTPIPIAPSAQEAQPAPIQIQQANKPAQRVPATKASAP